MLNPSDYSNPKLDPGTKAQLFQLFIEGKFAEIDAIFVAQNEALKALRGDTNLQLNEFHGAFAELNTKITQLEQTITSLSKPIVKSFWDLFK
jgi:hypothetical protein